MKRLFLTLLFTGLMAPAGSMAQKVYKDDGRFILDLTEDAGMPPKAITDVKKIWEVNPISGGTKWLNNTATESLNATVFQKLEIAPQDITGKNWEDSFAACNSTSGWRLPTQRELYLIYIFIPALDELGLKNFEHGTDSHYWCATEVASTNAWILTLMLGKMDTGNKDLANNNVSARARCVREVTD